MLPAMLRFATTSLVFLVSCAPTSPPASTAEAPSSEPEVRFVKFEGTLDLEGHLAKPGDTVELGYAWAQRCDRSGHCLVERRVDENDVEQIWSSPEAVWTAERRYSKEEADAHRRLLRLAMPAEEKPSGELAYAHPRLGDVKDSARYGEWNRTSGFAAPGKLSIDHHDTDVSFKLALSLVEARRDTPLEVPSPPAAEPSEAASIVSLMDGIWDVRLPEHDARSFVIQLDDGLLVYEAPWSSEAGEKVVDLIAREVGAPIRYVTFSHHHPHYTGGLRAFMASGVTVLVPQALEGFVGAIAERPFVTTPDRFARGAEQPRVKTFETEVSLGEGASRWVLHDIGKLSHHTDHYVVLWQPERALLLEGDIGWYVRDDETLRVTQRSAGLLQAIDTLGWGPKTMLQSWPVNSQAPSLTFERFRAAVEAAP